jgi:death-on-curing family protein
MEIEIDKEQLIEFNKTLIGAAHRVIKPHQLDSVFSSYFYYEDIPSQIASIVNSIIKNHPFGDGNKRTAMMTLYYLTQTYDVIIELEGEKEIFEAIQYVVNNKLEIEEVVEVLQLKEKGNDKNRS